VSPFDLEHAPDARRVGVELDPVAEAERPLHLDGEAGEEVPQRLLQREPDDRREQRRRREQRAEVDVHRAERAEQDEQVDDALREVVDDPRQRLGHPPPEDDVEREDDEEAAQRGEQERDRQQEDAAVQARVAGPHAHDRAERDVQHDERDRRPQAARLARRQEQAARDDEDERYRQSHELAAVELFPQGNARRHRGRKYHAPSTIRPGRARYAPAMSAIQANTYVKLDYTLRDDDGDVLDASEVDGGEPIEYVHGYGMLVPGLESALAGMKEGDERDVIVPAESGYGEYDDELVLEIDKNEFPDPAKVKAGDEFVAESPDGEEVAMEVLEVKDDIVVVDANHPLAGMTLHYSVKIRTVRDATEQEIHEAAESFEEAQAHGHVHGPGCDHSHDEEDPGLVTLGKKKTLN
jgi:FKBP-type peptidyl-prolyl cis-trans isomerase SlyD